MSDEKFLPEAVSIERAAQLMDLSPDTIRRLLKKGAFPEAFYAGRQVRIPRSDLLKFKRANQYRQTQR